MIVLGFGSTETAFEKQEMEAFVDYVHERYADIPYMTDAFVNEIRSWLDARAKTYRETAGGYKEAEAPPSRYSYFWPHIASSASCIVAIFKFSHINRRHAMSPDGWAMLQSERTARVFGWDVQQRRVA